MEPHKPTPAYSSDGDEAPGRVEGQLARDGRRILLPVVTLFSGRRAREARRLLAASRFLQSELAADQVVLSACNAGLGKEIRGESRIGIVGRVMYARAASVVAYLCRVDDEAPAEPMKPFYRHMPQENRSAVAG
jgi:CHAT domain-containing protein